VAAVAEREFLAIAVSLSAEVVPELREYERATTTLANAFVQPLMDPPARVMGLENLQCAGVD
jgi:5-oxoprolinase (ATP-hydrolysing)